jgi:hypothetical protein
MIRVSVTSDGAMVVGRTMDVVVDVDVVLAIAVVADDVVVEAVVVDVDATVVDDGAVVEALAVSVEEVRVSEEQATITGEATRSAYHHDRRFSWNPRCSA